jgi:hypothetical protein
MCTIGFMIVFLLLQFHAPWYDFLIVAILVCIDCKWIFGGKIFG